MKSPKTNEEIVEEFGNQFDELNMKPPKNSMPGLERELLKDFMRKALQAQRDAGAGAEKKRIYQEYIVLRKETKKERDLSNAWNDLGNTLRNGV